MGADSKIQWTHHTFNPWIGCTKVHTGCTNCYAEAQNGRWGYNGGTWGKGAPRKITSDSNWKQPLKWARDAAKAGERRRVFCASLADVLDEEAPAGAQGQLWDLIRATARTGAHGDPRVDGAFGLDWLLLTKRPERWRIIPEDVRPLVWLGASASDQPTLHRVLAPLLEAGPVAKRFLSLEPLIGPIDPYFFEMAAVDWMIVGGESGPKARPFDIAWARTLVRYCAEIGTACFVKQLGARPMLGAKLEQYEKSFGVPGGRGRITFVSFESEESLSLDDKKGGDWSEWPADLRVREFPGVSP